MTHANPRKRNITRIALALGLAALIAAILFSVRPSPSEPEPEPSETTLPATEPTTEPTLPPTTPADGDPEDVTCKGSYTVSEQDAASSADTVIAVSGDAQLTNRELQVYYAMAVSAYRSGDHTPAPDFDQPLDTQVCQIDSSVGSWQQYFLKQALSNWHTYRALITMGTEQGTPTEEAYQPSQKNHKAHMTDKPATAYLYGYTNASYVPNEIHQEYLDNLPTLLEELSQANGFTGLEAQITDMAGTATGEDALSYAEALNRAYMYFTERSYGFEPTAEEVEAWFTEHEEAYAARNITRESGYYVDIRHLLLVPEGAEVAEDGTVTCSEEAWEACRVTAQALLDGYLAEKPTEAAFAELANKNSADTGSALNGGLYRELSQGQLTDALDSWCFDPARQSGDTVLIRTDCGWHILYFSGSTPIWYDRAEEELIYQLCFELTTEARETYPMTVEYSKICLALAESTGDGLCPDDILYPDIAHQRYPTPPLYLQQDYPTTFYGGYSILSNGCGVTTMAMLATYMTDTELTPPEMCARYGHYSYATGTSRAFYDEAMPEMNFFNDGRSYSWEEVEAALRNGQVVISIQTPGYWTFKGHFILLQEIREDGMVVVRDSNIFNFGRLANHKIDAHTVGSITANSQVYWILQKKVTQIPTCQRCGEAVESIPWAMFTADYECEKCDAALLRRDNFTAVCEAIG